MLGTKRLESRLALMPPAVMAAMGLGLVGQAAYARSRDLPSFEDVDASGFEGPHGGPTRTILALGDSTLTGPGLGSGADVWIRQATRMIAGRRRVRIISLAVGGSRASDLLTDQLPAAFELDQPVDVVALAVGSNDALHGTRLTHFESNLHALVAALRVRAGSVAMCGIGSLATIPRVPDPLAQVLGQRGRRIDRVIVRVAAEFDDVSYIPTRAADHGLRNRPDRFTDDRFHPNAEGHRQWALIAAPALAEALVRAECAGVEAPS